MAHRLCGTDGTGHPRVASRAGRAAHLEMLGRHRGVGSRRGGDRRHSRRGRGWYRRTRRGRAATRRAACSSRGSVVFIVFPTKLIREIERICSTIVSSSGGVDERGSVQLDRGRPTVVGSGEGGGGRDRVGAV